MSSMFRPYSKIVLNSFFISCMILCSLVDPFKGTESVNMLEPIKDVYLTNETYLNIGTDVRAVLLNPQSPSQIKISLDKYGRDRIQLNLREAN